MADSNTVEKAETASDGNTTMRIEMHRIPNTRFEFHDITHDYLTAFTKNWLIGIDERNPAVFEMFADRDKKPYRSLLPWSGEFAGKYLTHAVQILRLTNNQDLRDYLQGFVDKLVSMQASNGYLGPWPKECQLTGKAPGDAPNKHGHDTWDTWNHYHIMVGLLMWYEDTQDAKALRAAERIGDLLCETFSGQPGKLVGIGSPTMNLAPVHSMCLLYRSTGKAAYLNLAKEIAEQEFPLAGDYVRTALAGKEFYQTPLPRWESLHPIMGIAELYAITGDEEYKEAFEHIWWSIVKLDRHNTGGFSSGEQAHGNPYHRGAIETCCTVAWSAMSVEMLRLTGNSIVADELELTLWNATLGSLSRSGKWSTYNTPMEGRQVPNTTDIAFQIRPGSEELNCCSVNAPRGLGMISDWAVMTDGDGLVLNWYGRSTLKAQLKDVSVALEQKTDYPRSGKIQLTVTPDAAEPFSLKLRIPYWSRKARVTVNGQAVEGVHAGSYLALNRTWKQGDLIEIDLDMSPHYWAGEREYAGKASIYRGPILLAYNPDSSVFGKAWKRFGESHCSKTIGATVNHEFVGDCIKWVGATFDDAGKALVEIDGKKIAIVDQYGPTRGRPFVWEHKGLGPGKHTIRLTIIEDKTPKSLDHWINIKSFNDRGGEAVFDAKTIAPVLMSNGAFNAIVALEVTNTSGKKVRLLDFDSACETGENYVTWFQIDNVKKSAFSRKNPLRSCR